MEEKVITAGVQESAEVSTKAALLQGTSSTQESKNIDKVIHQVRISRHTFPKSKTVKASRRKANYLKTRTKNTTAKLFKLKSKFHTPTKTQ